MVYDLMINFISYTDHLPLISFECESEFNGFTVRETLKISFTCIESYTYVYYEGKV